MYTIKNKTVYFLVGLLVLLLPACKKWVDAPAPLQINQTTLFSNEQGFTDALNGVYLQMGNADLYGKDLTFGLLSVMGRSYDTTISPAISSLYYQGIQYNFQDATVKTAMKNMWNEMYFSIGNLNNMLANIDAQKNVFAGNDYQTTKAEALGLRAYLHFELVRLFAPSPAVGGLSVQSLPYVITLSPYATPSITTGAFLDSCISDLQKAKTLFNNVDAASTSRFNTYAVKGLLARIYLYKGDFTNAQTYANDVINSNKFPLAVNNTDLMFVKEHLFSLYSYSNNSAVYYKSVLNTTPPLGFTAINQTALFVTGSGTTNDWRKTFNDPATLSTIGNTISPRKFYSTNANILPLIRATEMYYIATECAISNNDLTTATALLDTVRVHRNVPKYTLPSLTSDSLKIELAKEYQKEFLGEGQLFYYYKRKNLPFATLPYTKIAVVPNATYVFVKPE